MRDETYNSITCFLAIHLTRHGKFSSSIEIHFWLFCNQMNGRTDGRTDHHTDGQRRMDTFMPYGQYLQLCSICLLFLINLFMYVQRCVRPSSCLSVCPSQAMNICDLWNCTSSSSSYTSQECKILFELKFSIIGLWAIQFIISYGWQADCSDGCLVGKIRVIRINSNLWCWLRCINTPYPRVQWPPGDFLLQTTSKNSKEEMG